MPSQDKTWIEDKNKTWIEDEIIDIYYIYRSAWNFGNRKKKIQSSEKWRQNLKMNSFNTFLIILIWACWSGNVRAFMDQYSLVAGIYIAPFISFHSFLPEIQTGSKKRDAEKCLRENNKRKLRRPVAQEKPIGETLSTQTTLEICKKNLRPTRVWWPDQVKWCVNQSLSSCQCDNMSQIWVAHIHQQIG